ncbi:hypothetical protein CRM22_000249 [Opisthorchis felineus]|uniref:Cleavage and polyadenylation specificity factor subunit 1 n=1 Tax=Opisthorchis felineus TaxID=147828 RepID=A0A4V3SHB5_OPIFE|nr:hypothetical protein CRM22_000249 [Opisthorchis felineus]
MAAPNLLADPTKPTTFSALFKHISPPTAVDHCLYCHLTNPRMRNLVVTRGCFIDIYTLKENDSGKMHLNWITTSCVYEDIVDIVSVHFVGDRLDSLLLSFTEAKVAVMGFDPVQYELKTLSLHNYEFENLKSGRTHFSHLPILRVDPLQRCAVVLVYDRHLAVLPFRRSEALAAGDKYLAKPVTNNTTRGAGSLSWERRATAPLLATFTTCLSSSTGEKINNVLDMQFLNGFYEPTLLVLYEPIGTWAGVSARRDTCCIVALSFNLQKRTNPVIWFQESLPYDCTYVHSVPEPIGGVLILATNSIIYMKQTLPSCGLPLNCYAQVTTNFPMRQDVPQCGPLTLDGCRIVTMTDSQFLIVTRTGKMCLLSLWVEHTTQTVSSLLFHEIGCSVPPYSVALLDKGYVFVGSRLCDSVLLHLTASTMFVNTLGRIVDLDETTTADNCTTDIPMIERDAESMPVDKNNPTEKEAEKVSSETPTKPSGSIVHGPYVFDEVDVELYGDTILNPPSDVRELNTYKFEVADRLVNFGPMGLLTSGEVPCLAPGNTDPTDEALIAAQAEMHHVELLACIPRSFEDVRDFTKDLRAGGVMLLHTSVRPRGLTAFELPEYMSLWSLYGPPIMSPVPQKPIKVEEVAEDEGHAEPDSVSESTLHTTEDPVEENSLASNNEAVSNSLTVTQSAPEEPSITTELTKDVATSEVVDICNQAVNDSDQPVKLELEGPSRSSKGNSSTPSIKRCQGRTHSYLLLTREDSTMILEVSHEIVELEVSGFNTTEMTVTAVNLGGVYIETMQKNSVALSPSLDQSVERSTAETSNPEPMELADKKLRVGHDYPYILQVSPTSLRLLDGPQLLEYVQVTLEWRIHLASSADPYVLLCTEDDELVLIRLRPPDAVDAALPVSRASYKKPSFLDLRAAMEESEVEHQAKRNRDPSVPFTSTTRLEVFRPKVGQVSAPLCFCLYHDRTGHLSRWLWAKLSNPPESGVQQSATNSAANCTPGLNGTNFFPDPDPSLLVDKPLPQLTTSDEEDLILYGQLIELCKRERPEVFPPGDVPSAQAMDTGIDVDDWITDTELCADKSRYFAFIVFTNGVLEIYSLPDFTLLYEVHHFSDLPAMLVDCRAGQAASHNPVIPNPSAEEENIPPTVLEITVFPIGRNRDRPVLLVRTSQEIAFFEALCPSHNEAHPFASESWSQEGLRWRRLPIPCPLVAPRRVRTDPKIADVQSTMLTRKNLLRPFEDIDGHCGVFVCGATPIWLFSSDTGHIRVFNHSIDGIMGSFAPLNTDICPSGFVYFTYSNEMRLATLLPGYSFQEHLGMRWVPLELTPYFLQYHIESKTYALVGTRVKSCSSVYHLNAEGNKEEEVLLRPPTCVLPSLDYYVLQMYAPSTSLTEGTPWQAIPHACIDFEPWEVVTCMITAQLSSEQTFHGTKDYLALGANLSYGEEIPVRGRIIILDVIDVVPEPGQPLTRHKLKTIYDGEQKGPVTALSSCQGHLVSAIGQKVYIWTLKNADLVGVAFVDSELYIHSLLCVKNLILAADVLKSIQLLRFQSDLRVLSVVSRDAIPREVYTSNFFVDGRRLGFSVTDERGNVVIYSYDPLEPSSRSGRRLVRRADMCLPTRAISSLRVANRLRHALLSVKSASTGTQTTVTPAASVAGSEVLERTGKTGVSSLVAPGRVNSASGMTLTTPSATNLDPEKLKHSVYLGTQTGAVFLIGPLRDKMYSRLRITEKNLIHHFGPTCGLLPKLCWNYRPSAPELVNPSGQVADADLLWRYLTLPHSQRLEIAKKSGQSLEGIMDDIAELNATTLHF